MNTVIITDSCCDLPLKYIEENSISALGIICNFKGKDFIEDFGKTIPYDEFYREVRNGEMPTTAQINSYRFVEEFKKHVDAGKSIIYLAFSSALSGTYNSALIAKEEILSENPNADISVIDTRSASMGEGLIVYYAVEMLKNGASKEEIVHWVESNKLKINHWFTVDDLNHLKRGGRVSAASAAIGTILDIKPILNVNDEGKLIPISKVKGRKKAIKTLSEKFTNHAVDPENQMVFISHGDCLQEALILKEIIEKEHGVKSFMINHIGPVIGSHSGPGTIALFFIGENRSV